MIRGRRTWLVAASASLVLTAGVLTVVLDGGQRGAQTVLRVADDPVPDLAPTLAPTPDPVPSPSTNPSADPTRPPTTEPSAAPVPGAPDSAPPVVPDPVASATVPAVTPTGTDLPDPARCLGPLQPGQEPDAWCDAQHPHEGLPHPCLGVGYACEWPDARGVITGGCFDISATVEQDTIRATWHIDDEDLLGNRGVGPVHHMVVTLTDHDVTRAFVQRVFPLGTTSTVFEDVAPGDYTVVFQELNDSGLSGGTGRYATVTGPAGTPAPAATATPEPSPSP